MADGAISADFESRPGHVSSEGSAGAILAMLVDTMIPEAFEEAHDFAGLITVAGFLCAFVLSKAAG